MKSIKDLKMVKVQNHGVYPVISDEEEFEIEISPLYDRKSCFNCKTVFGKVKTNGFLLRNVTIDLVRNAFKEALI